jgi:hypothetical protein
MPWESRGGNRYYYRKRRDGRHVVSEYLGSGITATLIAECEAARRQEEVHARAAEHRRRAPVETARQTVRSIAGDLRTLVAAVLVANGFHQHKRQWRRRMRPLGYGELSPVPAALAPPDPAEVDRGLKALDDALAIKAEPAKKGKAADVADVLAERERRAAVRQVLRDYPCIWPHLRSKLTNARRALLEAAGCHPDTTTGMVVVHAMKAMRSDLGYEHAPMLEQLLIEQVVLAWFDFDLMQQYYAGHAIKNHTLTAGAYWDRRLNSAQQRSLRAIETLARVRRLSRNVPLQINIGGQQVNVAGEVCSDP